MRERILPMRYWLGVGVALSLLGVAGCSSSGGGSSSPVSQDPSFFETQEYGASFALEQLAASSAYAAGASGSGVTVAVIDTGIDVDHPEFDGAIHPSSVDIVTGKSESVLIDDVDGHGTAVAGLIGARRNGELSHGVAYDARLLVVRADEVDSCTSGCTFRQSDVAAATDYAVGQGAPVINYSLGGVAALSGLLTEALARAVDAGTILVMSAGNAGESEPGFPAQFASGGQADGRVLAVGAVDASGTIASFSNRAGSAQDVFLVAPGVNVLAPAIGGGARMVSGTSFAAPHVSGAAALVLEASPFLQPEQVVDVLLESATDLGDPGPDPIYGHGMVNLGAALGPLGTLSVPLGSVVDERSAPLSSSGLMLGSAYGAGPQLGRAIFVDGYGRPYDFDLNQRLRARGVDEPLARWLRPRKQVEVAEAALDAGAPLALSLANRQAGQRDDDRRRLGLTRVEAGESRPDYRLSLRSAGSELVVSRGWALGNEFGLGHLDGAPLGGLVSTGALRPPLLSLGDGGDALAFHQRLGAGFTLGLGLGHAKRDSAGFGSDRRMTLAGEISRSWSGGGLLAMGVGVLDESDSLLDARGGGALALSGGGLTRSLDLAGALPLGYGLTLLGHASYGVTEPAIRDVGLIEDVTTVRSSAYALGLRRERLVTGRDRLSLIISQPLRAESGTLVIDRPIGRTFEGKILRVRETASLAPEAREVAFELTYETGLELGTMAVSWLSRLHPGHDPDRSADHLLALRYGLRF